MEINREDLINFMKEIEKNYNNTKMQISDNELKQVAGGANFVTKSTAVTMASLSFLFSTGVDATDVKIAEQVQYDGGIIQKIKDKVVDIFTFEKDDSTFDKLKKVAVPVTVVGAGLIVVSGIVVCIVVKLKNSQTKGEFRAVQSEAPKVIENKEALLVYLQETKDTLGSKVTDVSLKPKVDDVFVNLYREIKGRIGKISKREIDEYIVRINRLSNGLLEDEMLDIRFPEDQPQTHRQNPGKDGEAPKGSSPSQSQRTEEQPQSKPTDSTVTPKHDKPQDEPPEPPKKPPAKTKGEEEIQDQQLAKRVQTVAKIYYDYQVRKFKFARALRTFFTNYGNSFAEYWMLQDEMIWDAILSDTVKDYTELHCMLEQIEEEFFVDKFRYSLFFDLELLARNPETHKINPALFKTYWVDAPRSPEEIEKLVTTSSEFSEENVAEFQAAAQKAMLDFDIAAQLLDQESDMAAMLGFDIFPRNN